MESPAEVIEEIKAFKKQIDQMDNRIRLYLSDREAYSHPFPETLISRIRAYESRIHRYLKGFRNTEIELRLDNLLYSLLVHERIWKRQLEESSQNTD